jgi:hypothetical protein
VTRREAVAVLIALSASLARAQGIPPAEDVAVDLRPEPRAVGAFARGRALRLTLTPLPPGAVDPLPPGRALHLTLTPLAPEQVSALPPGRSVRLAVNPLAPADIVDLPAGRVVRLRAMPLPSGPADPAALSAIAAAQLPTLTPLSVTLVPPATPFSALAVAKFPAPQSLSVTLVPPPTPLAAIGLAKFPDAAPLSVTLYAGEPLVAATMLAGMAPSLVLGPGQYTVQIVQVIPRRGAQFFDYRDPTGAGTVLVAGATTQTASGAPLAGGGGPLGPVCVAPATPPLSADICGTTLSLTDDGFPFAANLGPQGNRSMHLTPVGGAQIQIAAQTGITPNATCPGLLCMTTQVFTPGAACDNVSFVDTGTPKAPIVKFRRNGGQVCAQRLQ